MPNGTGVYGDREVVAALNSMASVVVLGDIDAAAIDSMKDMLEATREHYKKLRLIKSHPDYPRWKKLTPPGKHIYQNIVVRKTKGTASKRQYWLAGRGPAKSLLHLVEFGTSPHFQPKRKWNHPGARPKPGMAPAFEAHGDEVVERMGKALWERIQDRAITLGRKQSRRR